MLEIASTNPADSAPFSFHFTDPAHARNALEAVARGFRGGDSVLFTWCVHFLDPAGFLIPTPAQFAHERTVVESLDPRALLEVISWA
ncbi:hypothetical protein [Leucobacter sp.]